MEHMTAATSEKSLDHENEHIENGVLIPAFQDPAAHRWTRCCHR